MRIFLPAVIAVALLASGCATSTKPRANIVSGTVYHRDGQVAASAYVKTDEGVSTQADAQGHYAVIVKSSRSVTVYATAWWDPALPTVGTWSGRVIVSLDPSLSGHVRETTADIVLDRFDPI